MKRREFLKGMFLASSGLLFAGGCVKSQWDKKACLLGRTPRLNIIFCMADDQGWGDTGYNGHQVLKTPHLDEMAADVVYFENAYHASPICQPARASIMLGQYVNTHYCGFDRPAIYSISKDEFSKSYPAMLRKAGYYTGFVGKFGFPVAEQKVMNVNFVKGKRITESQLWKKDDYTPMDQFDVWEGFSGQGTYQMQMVSMGQNIEAIRRLDL